MTKTPAQQLILEATISCIEKYGIEKTTTRKIAEQAGTNIASINYYFRSKDDLIAQALDETLQHMREDLLAIVQDVEKPFDAVLRGWIKYLLEGAQQYPGVFMAHMYAPLVEKRVDAPVAETFRSMLAMLEARAAQAYPQTETTELHFALVAVVSGMMFKVLAPGFFQKTKSLSPAELAKGYAVMFARAISAQ